MDANIMEQAAATAEREGSAAVFNMLKEQDNAEINENQGTENDSISNDEPSFQDQTGHLESGTVSTDRGVESQEVSEDNARKQVESLDNEQIIALADKLGEEDSPIPPYVLNRYKKAIKEREEALDQRLNQFEQALQGMSSQQPVQQQPQQVEEKPLFDPNAYAEKVIYEPEEAAQMTASAIQKLQEQINQATQQTQQQQLVNTYKQQLAQQESSAGEEYQAFKQKYQQGQFESLKAAATAAGIAATDAQIQQEVDARYENAALNLIHSGVNPANYLVQQMRAMGVEVSTEAQPKNNIDLDSIATSISKHKGLNGGSSVGGGDSSEPTSAEVLGWAAGGADGQRKLEKFGRSLAKQQKVAENEWPTLVRKYVASKQ